METRLLRYFLTVAHEENITRAAEKFISHAKCFLSMNQSQR